MKLKKLFAVLLLFTLASATILLCSCNKDEAPQDEQPAPTISVSELGEYRFIISNDFTDDERVIISGVIKQIYSKYGVMPKSGEDVTTETAKEVLIGKVNREQTNTLLKDMKYDDYYLGINDGKLIVLGGGNDSTMKAVAELIRLIEANTSTDVFFTNDNLINYKHSYEFNDIKINGKSAAEYTIMYATGRGMREETLARAVNKVIVTKCGINVPVLPDTEGAYGSVIFVGGTEAGSCLKADGDVIYVSGAVEDDFFFAAQTLISRLCSSDSVTVGANETLQYSATQLDLSAWGVSREKLTFMSYNMQNLGNNQHPLSKYNTIAAYIDQQQPDVLAFQECKTSGSAAENLLAAMSSKDRYDIVTKMGITSGFMYNKEKLSLVETGSEQIGASDDEYGSTYNIFMIWAMFESKTTGERFVVQSIHIAYEKAANKVQLQAIIDFMQERFADVPAVMLGDYNLEYNALDVDGLNGAGFESCAKTASKKVNANEATFPSKNIIIDFIFEKGMTAEYYETLMPTDNPSDHRPLYAELYID